MLDKEESQRLGILRFPLIVGVVFIHAYGSDVGFAGGTVGAATNAFADFIRNLISQGVARTAVPLFFLMSGYLFFLGFDGSGKSYRAKLASRFQTLLVPFVIWNVATLALYATVQALPATQAFVSGNNARIAAFGWYDYLNAIFGLDRSPISYQFWFIRDLMMLVLLTPLIHFFVSRMALLFIAAVTVCWFSNYWPLFTPSSSATLFFATGAALSCHGKSLFQLDAWAKPVGLAYLCVLLLDVSQFGTPASEYIHRVCIVLGSVAFLCLTKVAVRKDGLKNALLALASASFFVFAAHEPLLTIFRKIAFKIVQPSSSTAILTLYFLIPVCLIMLLVALYRLGARYLPGVTRVIAGGR